MVQKMSCYVIRNCIWGGVRVKLNKFIQTSFSTGAIFNHSLKYLDNQGKVNIKDGIYAEFRTQIRF